ncbi:MAG: hypothetical protein GOU99_00360 [Candidatus Altiarchaeota archaeon]|nr:hypothetical protein [Candidatus Altiarchaeota archaeon]
MSLISSGILMAKHELPDCLFNRGSMSYMIFSSGILSPPNKSFVTSGKSPTGIL